MKRASITASLRHKKPTSSVEADIVSASSLSQPQPKLEASTATSKNYSFKKGDRVKFLGASAVVPPSRLRGPPHGSKGVVLAFEGNAVSKVGVRFDKLILDGSNLGGYCEDNHGFFCGADLLSLENHSTTVKLLSLTAAATNEEDDCSSDRIISKRELLENPMPALKGLVLASPQPHEQS